MNQEYFDFLVKKYAVKHSKDYGLTFFTSFSFERILKQVSNYGDFSKLNVIDVKDLNSWLKKEMNKVKTIDTNPVKTGRVLIKSNQL